MILHISLWDWSKFAEHEFMGHLSVPFSDILDAAGNTVKKWFNLLPAPGTPPPPPPSSLNGIF